MRFPLAAALLAFTLAMPAAFAQLTPVGPNDTLIYQRSENPRPGPARNLFTWPGGELQTARLIRKPQNQMVIAAGKSFQLFDPFTFGFADLPSAAEPNAAYPVSIETNRTTREYPTGQRWGTIVQWPYKSPDGSCSNTMRQEIRATSDGVLPVVADRGETVDRAALSVTQEGRYNNSCGEGGAYRRVVHYSRELQAPTMIEYVALDAAGAPLNGYRLVLREIRRAP